MDGEGNQANGPMGAQFGPSGVDGLDSRMAHNRSRIVFKQRSTPERLDRPVKVNPHPVVAVFTVPSGGHFDLDNA